MRYSASAGFTVNRKADIIKAATAIRNDILVSLKGAFGWCHSTVCCEK
jgi:hypothetical protein